MGSVKIRFWDGLQQYEGEVRQLTEKFVLARVRIFDAKEHTILPREDVVNKVIKRLKGRVLPFEIGRKKTKADLLAKLEKVSSDPSQPRRLIVRAAFTNPEAVNAQIMAQLMEETRVID